MKHRFYLAKFITPIILGFLLGLSLLVLITYNQDSLQKYFPGDTLAYASFKDGRRLADNKLLKEVLAANGADSAISAQLTGQEEKISIALISAQPNLQWLVAADLNKGASISAFADLARRLHWQSFQITRPYDGEQIFFISNSKEAIETISGRVSDPASQVLSLGSNLQLKPWRIFSRDGYLELNLEKLKAISTIPTPLRNQLGLFTSPMIDFDLKLEKGNLIASNAAITGESDLTLEHAQEVSTAFSWQQSGEGRGLLQSLVKESGLSFQLPSLGRIIAGLGQNEMPQSFSLLAFDGFKSWHGRLDWKPAENGTFNQNQGLGEIKIKKIATDLQTALSDFLKSKNQTTHTVTLPDYSTIKEVIRDPQSVETVAMGDKAQIKDLQNNDSYEVRSSDQALEIDKNYVSQKPTPIEGCKGTGSDNYLALDLQKTLWPNISTSLGKLLILEHNLANSPTYPQFSFCFY